ncbi:MAG: methyltransferase domain-containing protein [Alphaproteobacteria bacterium]|nr:MAG: methyltransferase domain-containing protein [Alphaproteobacteria bacterium]
MAQFDGLPGRGVSPTTVRRSMRPITFDRMMRNSRQRSYFENSGYFNFGYWASGAKSQPEASGALVDQMVARIANKTGSILDVACGLGGAAKRLTHIYPPEMITGINISEAQIADARALAPGCTFQVMNATKLGFPDNHFDAVICIESACCFDTRDTFLKEALRVLKPGGSLAMSDILFRTTNLLGFGQVPPANMLPSIAEYCTHLAAAGFVSIEVTDATGECLGGFCANLRHWAASERRAGRMGWSRSVVEAVIHKLLAVFYALGCKTYLLVSAHKPS